MKISRRCEYALRALFELTRRVDEGPIRIEKIAQAQSIPKNLLANLLVQLKRGSFVQSRKGPDGGYFLARAAREIIVGDIVRLIDGPLGPIGCVSQPGDSRCTAVPTCGFFPLWKRVHEAVATVVDHTTIEDVVEESRQAEAARENALMYHI